MIKLSDYVTQFLVEHGVEDIFLVSGGGIMHLVDSVGRQAGLRYICNHHEQACAIAAESYARRRNQVGACLVTTGPGATNALSAVAGAWVDSVPVVVVSGQVRRDIIADYGRFRQLGPQEINILEMARPVTKHAVTIMDPSSIRFEMEKAWHLATHGRPGPVWIDIPLDVQASLIDEENLEGFESPPPPEPSADLSPLLELLQQAKRPLWVFGQGIRLAGAADNVTKFLEYTGIPAVTTIGAMDLIPDGHPMDAGRFGPVGQRRGNFAIQNSDLLLAVGASLSLASIGFNTESLAPQAKRVMVNIDAEEFHKPTLRVDLGICSHAKTFMQSVMAVQPFSVPSLSPDWVRTIGEWRERYLPVSPEHLEQTHHVNTYVLAEALSKVLRMGDTVVTGNSLDIVSIYQSFRIKPGQRVYTNINFGAMGWDLPAAVGAAASRMDERTILFTGDGSIQFNLQEFLTIKQYGLNIKVFILNNGGYEAIRSTQRTHFDGRLVGSHPGSGIGNPEFRFLAKAYGMHYAMIEQSDHLEDRVLDFIEMPGAGICEVMVDEQQTRMPKVTSARAADGRMESRPLQDMFPFLLAGEVSEQMEISKREGPTW